MPERAALMRGELLIPLLERKRLLDSAWVASLVASFGTVSVLWFMSILDVDLERAAWFVLAYIVVYLAAVTFADRLTSPFAVTQAIRGTTLTSIVFLGVLWHLVGGLDNPMFLLMFTLPVLMSGVMMVGSLAHVVALTSIVIVSFVALYESPDLRWYFARFHLTVPWVTASLPDQTVASALTARQLDGPAYEFTLIATFASMQLIVAFVSTPVTLLLRRINARFETSDKLRTEVQGLFHALLRAAPDPSVIVYADSGQVVQASDSFFHRMLVRPSQMVGRGLFEIVQFVDPKRVADAFESSAGHIPFCVYHVGQETRIANLSFHRTDHAGTAYVYLGWQELTELYYLQSAMDAIEDPLVVVSDAGLLYYANDTSKKLFGSLHFGMDTSMVPMLRALLTDVSDVTDERGTTRHEINGAPYALSRLVAPLPGESETCTILWLHCIAHEEALFQQAVRDPLTGIYNRRYFDDALEKQIERSKRGQKLALAYFDLDKFKSINDRFGHAGGDMALLTFVSAVKAQLREADIFARRGGDEFAVIFVDCETDVAASAIERLRVALAAEGCVHEGSHFEIGFSVGLAACRQEDDVDELLARADRAVYEAKERGRGRLVIER
jgi:diguanylate cyclase (GGDEF)-like protein